MKTNINSTEFVKQNYGTSKNLDTRISIHDKYSSNTYGYFRWIFDQYGFFNGCNILEVGCGNGMMWKDRIKEIGVTSKIVLSDFSDGMLESAKEALSSNNQIEYKIIDVMDISFQNNTFDFVIANNMLYHAPDLETALKEIKRVLKDDGIFYTTISGDKKLNKLNELLEGFGLEVKFSLPFTEQEFLQTVKKYFDKVERKNYVDSLEITDVEDLYHYLMSGVTMSKIKDTIDKDMFINFLKSKKVNGILHIPKDSGLLILRNNVT